jgi:hypothetical protein
MEQNETNKLSMPGGTMETKFFVSEYATIGEFRMQIHLNSEANEPDDLVKKKCAELINLINDLPVYHTEHLRFQATAAERVEEAGFWAVRAATFKHK